MISIITPLYNSTKYFRRCCESVAAQSYQDFEWILVDDHGEEDSVSVAKRVGEELGLISKMRFFATEKNSGPGEARNVGLQEAQGEYVVFLDADDWIEPNSYELILETMESKLADMAYYNGIEHRKSSEEASAKEQTSPMITIPFKSQKQFLCNYV
ncbi:MAG: glycosyltransferase family 2 protein, partial [Bacteroidales bacterium]|nr:glycosyltransferase family 2 protein [Bacteroidales bacterium]